MCIRDREYPAWLFHLVLPASTSAHVIHRMMNDVPEDALNPDSFIGAMKRIKKDRLKQNNNFDKAEKWEEWKELPDDEEGIDYPGAEIEEEEYVEEEEEEEEEEGSKPAPRREEAEAGGGDEKKAGDKKGADKAAGAKKAAGGDAAKAGGDAKKKKQ
eukprot:TRINITY_DN906_c0_g1_i10.p2 TRINITY_DN906_c0_g1~~TRINITY_DN906_c0_g1_i10.p2  ORF type:complete len:157 (+),score=59.88 TRINITY_DN906_c0_g1_i10:66-536(+)